MKSYLNMIMNLNKEITLLKNKRSHINNPLQRKKMAQLISELETFLKLFEEKIQPLLDEIGSPLKDMVLDSYLKGKPFSYGVDSHLLDRDTANARMLVNQKAKATGKTLTEEELEDSVRKIVDDKYRKQLCRAIEYFETH